MGEKPLYLTLVKATLNFHKPLENIWRQEEIISLYTGCVLQGKKKKK